MPLKTVFVVDDSNTNRLAAKRALDGSYVTYALPSAARMFDLAEKIKPDLILLDVEMPDMDGYEALSVLKSDDRLKDIPVVYLTGKCDTESEIRGFEMGALDYISKPFSAPVLLKRIESHIETDLLVKKSKQAVRDLHNATIRVISDVVESRDKVTGGHIGRTQRYLELLLDELVRNNIYTGIILGWNMSLLLPSSQLHDVGKIIVSDTILNKPGKLTDEEFALIMQHSLEGERIIDEIIRGTTDDGFLFHAKRFAGHHHERWDGKGYPRGLSGDDIPLEGRLMALVDVYDGLVSERPYKQPYTHDEAVEIITNERGEQFDPFVVGAFLSVSDEFLTLANNFCRHKQEIH